MEHPNLVWSQPLIGPTERSRLLGQRGGLVWFTGLPGAGKSTVAGAVEAELYRQGRATYLLDGEFNIDSKPGGGTHIEVRIPIRHEQPAS